ncbi:MAG: Adenylyl-sulfate kinase [Actinomycetota bacterium]|jgi:sulfate adenylyltransferase
MTSTPPISVSLDGARLDLLELIAGGLLPPIDGYRLPGTDAGDWPFSPSLVVAADVSVGGDILLTDPDGTALGRMTVAERERRGDVVFVSGRVVQIGRAEHPPARALRMLAAEDLSDRLIGVFDGPPHPDEVVKLIASAAGRRLVFLATTWNAVHGDYTVARVVDDLVRCSDQVPGSMTRFVALASSDPTTTPAAVLDAVLRAVGSPQSIDFRAGVDGRRSSRPIGGGGSVVLFTGLSGSGKSTIARAVSERLASIQRRSVLLDGDDVRRVLSAELGFSVGDREINLQRIGWVAARISSVGGIALCAPIAPFASTRAMIRAMAEEQGRFVLVHVATPLAVCEARDRKGLYARARAGDLVDFTGIDSPYEIPLDADLVVGAGEESLESIVERVMKVIA